MDSITDKLQVTNLKFLQLDLGDLNNVKEFAKNFPYDKVDILLNNAGMVIQDRELSPQGVEMQF